MSVLIMLLRKMARNRWLSASLFVGMLLCIALTSSMPIYKNAMLQRMLVQDLDRSYAETGTHPGVVSVQVTMKTDDPKTQDAILERFQSYWTDRIAGGNALRLSLDQQNTATVRFALTPADPTRVDPEFKRTAKFAMRTGMENRIRLIDGKLPAKDPVNGVYEVMVTDAALAALRMLPGEEYIVQHPKIKQPIRIRPSAVIEETDLSDVFWSRQNLQDERHTLFLPDALFERDFLTDRPLAIAEFGGLAVANYAEFDLDDADYMLALKANMAADMLGGYNYSVSTSTWVPGSDAMTAYGARESTLRILLWSLNVPLFMLIAFYFYMVSGMLVERQKPEIAVLRSRGASKRHLLAVYALEFGLLALAAFAAGPWLGAAFTRFLGSTSTFMNFVNRGSLQIHMDSECWLYAAAAAVAAWIVILIPVHSATRVSIVDERRAKARETARPVWQLFGLDAVLLAASMYGFLMFRQRMADLVKLGLDGKSLTADPFLYTVPTLFILGSGLFLIRIYPLFVSLVYRAGRRRWAPQQYSALLLVSRRNRTYHGLMVFLILTTGTGIYNANAARTINGNMEEQIRYAGGSDVVLRQHWLSDAPAPASAAGGPQAGRQTPAPDKIHYLEPPLEQVETLPGVERAAKVFTKDEAEAWLGNKSGKVMLMGIETDVFGETAWMKTKLLPHDFYDYLNLIAPDEHAVLLSKTAADHFGAKPGDAIDVGWEGIRPTRLVVYGIIDYFPSFNPNPVSGEDGGRGESVPMLIVAHLGTIQNELGIEPYDVWLKLAPGTDRQTLLDAMADRNIELEKFDDTIGKIALSRTDPFRMAVNGIMSLGFLISLSISLIGFMLFWLLSLQGRMLQLGIYRAMGISFRQLAGMLMLEQTLTTGAGFLIGIGTGLAAGHIFVPLLQLSFDPGRIVPPFEVISGSGDMAKLAVATCFMLAAALAILSWLLKRMNIHQAVKLGED